MVFQFDPFPTIDRHSMTQHQPRNLHRRWLPILGLLLAFSITVSQLRSTSSAQEPETANENVHRTESTQSCTNFTEQRQALFGDLHVHTSYSFDAAANSTGGTPADAYRFAQGEPIPFFPLDESGDPIGSVRLLRPLDFVAVTDHGEFLGERRLCREPGSPSYDTEYCKDTRVSERQGMTMFGRVIATEAPKRIVEVCGEDGELCREYAKSPWQSIIEAAEQAYDRSQDCTFTTFIGYEYTGTPGVSNYHRNVIFRNSSVPDLPVSYVEAPVDSELWRQLDLVCDSATGCDYLTIPHNTNLANGRMGPYRGLERTLENRRAYAKKRLEREPILEIFQHKGSSECINGLSTIFGEPDELCDIEAVRVFGDRRVAPKLEVVDGVEEVRGFVSVVTDECPEFENGNSGMLGSGCVAASDFVRSALVEGLTEEIETGLNPAKLGIIASTDTHTATPGAVSESDWRGHVSRESTPEERLKPGLLTSGIDGNPGGLAGVWAVENSRDAIFDALKRREVFGTSGPRIKPRFFAGWNLAEDLCDAPDRIELAYDQGVPMGADLTAPSESGDSQLRPKLFALAARDPADSAAKLQQLQLIKGWVDEQGQGHTQVIPIAGSPDNGASVNTTTGERSGTGHDTLCAVYQDDDFSPDQHAYYYLRVVENPSARWSVYDCQRTQPELRPAVCTDGSHPEVIQEMAWTSPIWYRP